MARKPAPPGCDRRQQILDAALALFAEQGLEGATSKDIAERAEVTHGLIYFYFKSKEELFKATFEYALERALAQLDLASIAGSDDPPEQTLNRLLERLLETFTSPLMLSMNRLMMHTMAHKDWRTGPLHECKLRLNSTIDLVVREIRGYLDQQVALGRLRPVNTEIVARFLVGGVVSSVRWAQADGRFASAAQDTAQVIADTIIRGLLPASTVTPPTKPPTRKVPSAVGASAGADD
ncbi:MAG TPA: TetR/AcrR family transcriptional regulator [Ktedonobacterales bacterium]|nr:TetR/AcrR family transcriptional regulator [Ktedonobacterales bacterium]